MIGYVDCSTGISGDKLLGALLDIGTQTDTFTVEHLDRIVRQLAPEAVISVGHKTSHGIAGVKVDVVVAGDPPSRHLADIVAIIEAADLPEAVSSGAKAVFERLAEVEASAHGTGPEEVHFHELGGTDTIVDVVGVLSGLYALGLDRLAATPVAMGSGTVETAHGRLPVPAPATIKLLTGVPAYGGYAEGELTTPTGAALISFVSGWFGPCPPIVPLVIGYGCGSRDLGMPNVCRIIAGEMDERAFKLATGGVTLLESNVDHVTPEAASFTLQQLIDEGCLDAWIAPIVMKKGRAAMLLSALVPREAAEHFAKRLVTLTGTLGVRRTDLERFTAEREQRVVDTVHGPVKFKVGAGKIRPEHDDVARIAKETGQPYSAVESELVSLFAPTEPPTTPQDH